MVIDYQKLNIMILIFIKELFYTLTGAIIIFTLLETFWPGVVLAYINLNWVLLFWLFVGIVIVLISRGEKIS